MCHADSRLRWFTPDTFRCLAFKDSQLRMQHLLPSVLLLFWYS